MENNIHSLCGEDKEEKLGILLSPTCEHKYLLILFDSTVEVSSGLQAFFLSELACLTEMWCEKNADPGHDIFHPRES